MPILSAVESCQNADFFTNNAGLRYVVLLTVQKRKKSVLKNNTSQS